MEASSERITRRVPCRNAFSYSRFFRSSVMDTDYIVTLCSAVVLAGLFVLVLGGVV
jgi:hypothetical protein